MSLGSIIGGVAGGVIGFFVGGPTGAYYGAVLGFGIGMALDPMTPDIPVIGIPNPSEQIMKSEVGTPIADLTGTAKVTGHLLCFGNERNEAVYSQSTGGGKGGSPEPQPQVTGFKYFASWGLGLIACPGDSKVNTLYAIYKNDDALPVWSGELDCPASGGQETIILDGIGSIEFYFGTNDQVANSDVGDIIADSTLNTPYRNMCWAFFDDCFIGEYNRTPTFKFIIKKIPEYAFDTNSTIQTYDVNPAHSLYYILSNLSGLPTSWLDSDDFGIIAQTLAGEYRGISVLFDRQQSVLSYLESINSHTDNIIRYGADAKFHPKLIRDDYDVESIPTIDESVMLEDPSFSRGSWIDTVNEVKVQYSEIINVYRQETPITFWTSGFNESLSMSDTLSNNTRYLDWEYIVDPRWAVPWKNMSLFENCSAIDKNDLLWTWGNNTYGENGQLSGNTLAQPDGMEDIKIIYIKSSDSCMCCIDENFVLYTSGWNRYHNIGQYPIVDTTVHQLAPVTLAGGEAPTGFVAGCFTFEYGAAIGNDGKIYIVGGQSPNPQYSGFDDITTRDVRFFEPIPYNNSGGFVDVLVRKNAGTWGLKEDGVIWACGANDSGQMGLGHTTNQRRLTVLPHAWAKFDISIDGSIFLGITDGGVLMGAGRNVLWPLGVGTSTADVITMTVLASGSDWIDCGFCGQYGAIALKNDGTLWSAGKWENNFQGHGTGLATDHRSVWTRVGTLSDWGHLITGQLFSYVFKK